MTPAHIIYPDYAQCRSSVQTELLYSLLIKTIFSVEIYLSEWLQAVQVLMILSAVFCSIAFLVFLGQLFIMPKGGLFYLTGVCQAFAGTVGNI